MREANGGTALSQDAREAIASSFAVQLVRGVDPMIALEHAYNSAVLEGVAPATVEARREVGPLVMDMGWRLAELIKALNKAQKEAQREARRRRGGLFNA